MPWEQVSIMDQRREFVQLAMQEGANRRELCRRFHIHPSTGYKWLGRWPVHARAGSRADGLTAGSTRSRKLRMRRALSLARTNDYIPGNLWLRPIRRMCS
jgi:transposase-like protein